MNRTDPPPHDLEAEKSVLGSILLDNSCTAKVMKILQPVDFYATAHREIYQRIVHLFERGAAADLVTLRNDLHQAGILDRVGGIDYVISLAETVPSSASVEHYAKIVKGMADRRRLIVGLTESLQEAYCGTSDVDAVMGNARKRILEIGKGYKKSAIDLSSNDQAVVDLAKAFEAEGAGERKTLPLPWPRLSDAARALRPGAVVLLAGDTGGGKSMLSIEAAIHLHSMGESFRYLVLEDTRQEWLRRALAHLTSDWRVLDDLPIGAEQRIERLLKHEKRLEELAECVIENPRLARVAPGGKLEVPPLPYRKVLDFIGEAAKAARLVVVDPCAQVDYGSRSWEGQGAFIRGVCAVAAHSGATILLFHHTIKRPNVGMGNPQDTSIVEGAKELANLSHTVLLIAAHDTKESKVWRRGGQLETVEHNRTLVVAKARNGPGRGFRIAMRMSRPSFEELGIIAPKQAASKARQSAPTTNQDRMPYRD